MERTPRSRSSSPDDAEKRRRSEAQEARDSSSDASSHSTRDHHLIGRGLNPSSWSEQASTSRASHSETESQDSRHETRQDKRDLGSLESLKKMERLVKGMKMQGTAQEIRDSIEKYGQQNVIPSTHQYQFPEQPQREGKELARAEGKDRRPIGEDGKPVPRAFNLSSESTLEHPILPGGMKRFESFFKGETSRGSDAGKYSGQRFGNYRLGELLGEGGFAHVYLGKHTELPNQRAAVKVLQCTHLRNSRDKEDFYKEAQTLFNLKHPHIVCIMEFGLKNEVPFLVMEYAPHGTIRDAHPQGIPLPLKKVVAYVDQIADALQYLHDRNLMHLDIKPLNILLGEKPNGEKEVLLSDFGLVQTVQNTTSQIIPERVAGTLAYMDPDYMQGGPPRPASDQYALGVMTYEWLSGKRPFQGDYNRIAAQHQYNVPPPPLHDIPGISREIERVVFRALKKDPKDRYPDVKTFAEAFKQACGDCSSSGEREKQALQEKHSIANQVQKTDQGNKGEEQKLEKKASISGASSLQKGDASSSSTGREGINRHAEQQLLDRLKKLGFRPNDNAWLGGKDGEAFLREYMHEFIQTEQGKKWFNSDEGKKWFNSKSWNYMNYYAHHFIQTEQGKKWFNSDEGEKWFNSDGGRIWFDSYDGRIWFNGNEGKEWFNSNDGKKYMDSHAHKFIQTEQGKAWYNKYGKEWTKSDEFRSYLTFNAPAFIQTEQGQAWVHSNDGQKLINGDQFKEYLSFISQFDEIKPLKFYVSFMRVFVDFEPDRTSSLREHEQAFQELKQTFQELKFQEQKKQIELKQGFQEIAQEMKQKLQKDKQELHKITNKEIRQKRKQEIQEVEQKIQEMEQEMEQKMQKREQDMQKREQDMQKVEQDMQEAQKLQIKRIIMDFQGR